MQPLIIKLFARIVSRIHPCSRLLWKTVKKMRSFGILFLYHWFKVKQNNNIPNPGRCTLLSSIYRIKINVHKLRITKKLKNIFSLFITTHQSLYTVLSEFALFCIEDRATIIQAKKNWTGTSNTTRHPRKKWYTIFKRLFSQLQSHFKLLLTDLCERR